MVDQLTELFHTTHTVKTEHVTKSRGRYCRDVEVTAYLVNATDPVPLVMDLHIVHDRVGSNSDLDLNGHLHYPNDIDKSLNETSSDKIRKVHRELGKVTDLRITLNLDGTPPSNLSHTLTHHTRKLLVY